MNKMENLKIRPLAESDIKVIGSWAEEEGWWDSEVTLRASVSHCPTGWLVAELNGQVVGCIAACNVGCGVTTAGYLAVDERFRRLGVAGKLMLEVKSQHAGENITATSVDWMVDTYKRYFTNAVTSFKVRSILLLTKPVVNRQLAGAFDLEEFDPTEQMEELVRYDRDVHVIPRRTLLSAWCTGEGTLTFIVRDDGKIVGFACLQPVYNNTRKIGPLFADTPEIARALFNRMVTSCPVGSRIGVIVIDGNDFMQNIIQQHDVREEYNLTRMYTERQVELDLDRVYALTDCGVSFL